MNSLKFEIETWAAALEAYDVEDWDQSLEQFSKIADNSKILTNIGLIYASLGEHEIAIENFNAATSLDGYLVIAYFQAGVSNFLLGRFEAAFQEFEDAFQFLRGNEAINYGQIGLKYQLYACSVLFNQGVTLINLGEIDRGMQILREASKNKVIPDHDVIDDAIQDQGEGYSVFSIPSGVLYRPNEKKVANMKSKDYMGKARLISTTEDAGIEFINQSNRSRPEEPPAVPSDLARTLTRSRSAAQFKVTAEDSSGPPRANAMGRSASTGSPSNAEVPVETIQPLSLNRAKSMKNLREAPGQGQKVGEQERNAPLRKPTLKLNSNVDLPPSPPRSPPQQRRGPQPISKYGDTGLTEIYDNYLQSNDDADGPLLPRVPKPTRKGTGTSPPLPTRAPRSNGLQKGANVRKSSSSSGSYPVGDERLGAFDFELRRIRVKLFFKEEARGMVVSPDVGFSEFLEQVCAKFSYEFGGLRLKFEDEDGTKVSLRDEGDWDMAVETVRDAGMTSGSVVGKPGEGRITIWCEEDYQ